MIALWSKIKILYLQLRLGCLDWLSSLVVLTMTKTSPTNPLWLHAHPLRMSACRHGVPALLDYFLWLGMPRGSSTFSSSSWNLNFVPEVRNHIQFLLNISVAILLRKPLMENLWHRQLGNPWHVACHPLARVSLITLRLLNWPIIIMEYLRTSFIAKCTFIIN